MIHIANPKCDPTKLSQKKKIDLVKKYPELIDILEGEKIEGSLDLGGLSITHLPKGLEVSKYLDLYGCTSLIHLPEGLKVGYYLDLEGCTSLTYLPEGLEIGDSKFPGDDESHLDIIGCVSLPYKTKKDFPKSIKIHGNILWGY